MTIPGIDSPAALMDLCLALEHLQAADPADGPILRTLRRITLAPVHGFPGPAMEELSGEQLESAILAPHFPETLRRALNRLMAELPPSSPALQDSQVRDLLALLSQARTPIQITIAAPPASLHPAAARILATFPGATITAQDQAQLTITAPGPARPLTGPETAPMALRRSPQE